MSKAIPFTFWHDREPLSYCLVRVRADDGVTGWGEACDSFGCTYASVIATVVADALAPLLVDEHLDSPDRLMHKLRSWTRRRLGHQWVASHALSGVELALWDALGKARDQPVATLLGGTPGPVPIYASSVFLEEGSAEWHGELLEPFIGAGVRAAKLRIGVDGEADLETLATIREQLDPAVALMIDGNENFTVPTALEIADRLGELGVRWFEEPVPQESPQAIEAVASGSAVTCGSEPPSSGPPTITTANLARPDGAAGGRLHMGPTCHPRYGRTIGPSPTAHPRGKGATT